MFSKNKDDKMGLESGSGFYWKRIGATNEGFLKWGYPNKGWFIVYSGKSI